MNEPEKMALTSKNITEEQKAKLKLLFPEVFNEDKIDFDKLKMTLGEDVDTGLERYGMTWPGKADCFKIIQEPSIGTLKPCRDESADFDQTDNLFIEGDNLEVLKLLQSSYYGKIKMIYIDPPYNTGKEFIYPDNYKENLDTYLAYTGQTDSEGRKFSTNTEADGRFHSKWINMMYPRLFLARNLFRDDGVIFISIDDNEVTNLRKICDEIFGEENFIAQIVWKKKTGAGSSIQHTFCEHEYLIVYSKNKESVSAWRILSEEDGNFRNPDNDARGNWESCAFTAPSKNRNPNQLYMIEVHYGKYDKEIEKYDEAGRELFDSFPYLNHRVVLRETLDNDDLNFSYYDEKNGIVKFIRRWAYAKNNVKQIFDQKRVFFNSGNIPRFKKFEKEYEGKALRSIYFNDFSTQQGTDSLRELFGESFVEYPKPVNLIRHFILGVTQKEDVILDFFSGSCTTAHAVLDLNKEDGGNRKFIMVQLPEPCDIKSEAYKAGYKSIADIGKERIRRVIKKIKEDQEGQLELEHQSIDLGFKVFKLDTSNFKIWNGVVGEKSDGKDIEEQIELHIDHINPQSSDEDILFELLIKTGFPLTANIEQINLAGKTVYSIEEGALLICLDRDLTKEVITEMARLEPARVICLDDGFSGNDQLKTNAVQIMKSFNVNDFKTV